VSPAPATSEPESAPSPRVGGRANGARRIETLTQMAERGQRDGEGRQRDGEGRGRARPGAAAQAGSSSQPQNPNVIFLNPGDPRRGGSLGQLFGGQ
jgi:hypothetical protein